MVPVLLSRSLRTCSSTISRLSSIALPTLSWFVIDMLRFFRTDQIQRLAAMPAVNLEIWIEGKDMISFIQFSHSDKTGISQRHRSVPVFSEKGEYFIDMFIHMKGKPEYPVFQQQEKFSLSFRSLSQQKKGFRQHRLTHQHGRSQVLHLTRRPCMIIIGLIKEGH